MLVKHIELIDMIDNNKIFTLESLFGPLGTILIM